MNACGPYIDYARHHTVKVGIDSLHFRLHGDTWEVATDASGYVSSFVPFDVWLLMPTSRHWLGAAGDERKGRVFAAVEKFATSAIARRGERKTS